jgi:hypothetical protein
VAPETVALHQACIRAIKMVLSAWNEWLKAKGGNGS